MWQVRLTRPPGEKAAKRLLAPPSHPITLLYPKHDWGRRVRGGGGPQAEGAGEPSGDSVLRSESEEEEIEQVKEEVERGKLACARIHAFVAELSERDPAVKAYMEWSAS